MNPRYLTIYKWLFPLKHFLAIASCQLPSPLWFFLSQEGLRLSNLGSENKWDTGRWLVIFPGAERSGSRCLDWLILCCSLLFLAVETGLMNHMCWVVGWTVCGVLFDGSRCVSSKITEPGLPSAIGVKSPTTLQSSLKPPKVSGVISPPFGAVTEHVKLGQMAKNMD